ncbi:dihydrolipoamide acetyltransferase family protein [Stakelama saccharophila]|uniref:Dihydrolipoamide acetyltransferase component of pyruvate dehydrogenase complex n=1 Tax=Stakelama saccharophila TaxID=3075605 RepID=A0ABZ0B9C9_9SPHN|nr:dihydrolipoamide acetyltransferase family protein [Stakelama sp. W311]WNO53899.1 dihydrolipoamide acetyltransferase family protein [Stakelama sp. W311]
MARFEFRLPDIGEGISEAEVVAWHVKVGDRVEEDQQLADMMTDKATVEMESPVAGEILELAGEAGDMIPIGSTLVVIETEGDEAAVEEQVAAETPGKEAEAEAEAACTTDEQDEAIREKAKEGLSKPSVGAEPVEALPSSSAAADKKEGGFDKLSPTGEGGAADRPVLASPAVRKRAKDLGIDLADVRGDGERVRHGDLDAYLRYGSGEGYLAPQANRGWADETVKVIGMRRRIAENMAASKRNIPHFTYVEEIDVTELEAMRASLNANRGQRPKLTVLPFIIVAICRALPDFPMINARYDDEGGVVTRSGTVNLGMATQTDAGLMVPVIRDAQDKNVWQLASEINRLAEAARTGKATSEEMQGGTLTVTSLGPLGGVATTPVINRPEVAIIGPNRIVERPVFDGDDIRRAKLMNLSISCDHRVVDGYDAASYVQAVKKLLETPVLLFAD